jgi:hypothetical protein
MKTSSAGLRAPLRARDRRVDHRDAALASGRRTRASATAPDDDVSSSSAPGESPASRPSSPITRSRTTSPFGTIVMTMSLARATSAGERSARGAFEARGERRCMAFADVVTAPSR